MSRMQRNGWRMQSVQRTAPVADGGRGRDQHSNSRGHFPRASVMQPTAVIHAQQRAQEKKAEIDLYLSPIPLEDLNVQLFEAKHIIAGEDLMPLGLDRPEVLDGVRIKNRTWISYDNKYELSLASDNPLNLKQACRDLYALIRDLRLTTERPARRYLVQRPSPWLNNVDDAVISIITGSRPTVLQDTKPTKACIVPIVEDLVPKTASHIMPLAMSLTGLDKDLQMRVSFGRLNLQKKKTKYGNATIYAKLPAIMTEYVVHDGAYLGSKLPIQDDAGFPELPEVREMLNRLTNERTGIRSSRTGVTIHHTLIITLREDPATESYREIRANMGNRYLGPPRTRDVETWTRLNWTVLAPDRDFDWNLRADAGQVVEDLPEDFDLLLRRATARSLPNQEGKTFKVREIDWNDQDGSLGRRVDNRIKEIQVKTSAVIPLEREAYIVEVSVTQTRPGLSMTKPDISWGVDFYGSQWEESLNYRSLQDDRRKDWGRGLANVWPNGKASRAKDGLESFETRFGHFLSCILTVQAAMEGLEIEELSESLI